MTHAPSHDAARALDQHLEHIGHDMQRWIDLFADDAVVEFPYASSIVRSGRLEGKAAIDRHFRGTPESFLDFTVSNVRRHPTTDPDVALAEVHGAATIASTGKRYEQDYVMMVKTKDGKIVLYREYWNPLPALAAFDGGRLPGGDGSAS